MLGNHDIRPWKRVLEKAPDCLPFMDFKTHFEFPGVTLWKDPQEPFVYNNIVFHHGYKSDRGAHVKAFGSNCVVGHTHRPDIFYAPRFTPFHQPLWELNVGHVARTDTRNMGYTPINWKAWSKSCGIIDDLGPRVVLL